MGNFSPLFWFFFNNLKPVKAGNVGFCSTKYHFIWNIHIKFSIHNSPSLQTSKRTQTGLSPISGFLLKPLMNKNCHNSRTTDNGMKLWSVPKLVRRNTVTLKMFDDDVLSANYDVIINLPICDWFGAIHNSDYGCMICDFYFSLHSFLQKNENKTKKNVKTFLILLFWVNLLFFSKKYLRTKFQVARVILTSFGWGECNFTPHRKTNSLRAYLD